jgi:hypothetical protein
MNRIREVETNKQGDVCCVILSSLSLFPFGKERDVEMWLCLDNGYIKPLFRPIPTRPPPCATKGHGNDMVLIQGGGVSRW